MNSNITNLKTQADQILLQNFSPAAVLIDFEGDIVYINGRTGKYLEVPAGKPNWNIHLMAHKELRHHLGIAIKQAQGEIDPVHVPNIALDSYAINLTVQAIKEPNGLRGLLIVVFTDIARSENHSEREPGSAEKDALNELQLAHESIQSLRDELRSSDEKLAITKDECQSLNEELKAVNAELAHRFDEFSLIQSDMENLLNSTEVATIFLDDHLHIRRFTAHTSTLFYLLPSDMGRPLSDIVNNLEYVELEYDSRKVLDSMMFIEKYVSATDKRWIKVRIMPYRNKENRIDGVVITFIDSTSSKQVETGLRNAQIELEKSLEDLERIFSLSSYMVCIASPEGTFRKVSPAFSETLGFSEQEFLTQPFVDFVHPEDKHATLETMEPMARGIPITRFPNRYICKDGSYKWLEWSARSFTNGGDIYAIAYDITDRKLFEEERRSTISQKEPNS
jgi:PAS domain S-box-containing protein